MRAVHPEDYRGYDAPDWGAPAGPTGSRVRRSIVALAVTGVALIVTATLVRGLMGAQATAAAPAAAQPGTVQTRWGPLTADDRDMVVAVREAALWEAPTAEQAQQRAGSAVVKDVSKKIMNEHMQLDQAVRMAASQLGMGLPNEPSSDEKSWMAQLSRLNGPAFDKMFVERVRVANGKAYELAANVRSTTTNSVVRSLAVTDMQVMRRHMTYLESTGLTNASEISAATNLPQVPMPVRKVTDSGMPTRNADKIILVALALAGFVNFIIFRRSRRRWPDMA